MPGWLYIAKKSTGTIWESWERGDTNASVAIASLNHYSKGAMVEFLFTKVLGINIKGENKFEISPIVGGTLSYTKGTYRSIYGKISSERTRKNGEVTFKFEIPGNTKALFKYGNYEKEYLSGTHEITLKK